MKTTVVTMRTSYVVIHFHSKMSTHFPAIWWRLLNVKFVGLLYLALFNRILCNQGFWYGQGLLLNFASVKATTNPSSLLSSRKDVQTTEKTHSQVMYFTSSSESKNRIVGFSPQKRFTDLYPAWERCFFQQKKNGFLILDKVSSLLPSMPSRLTIILLEISRPLLGLALTRPSCQVFLTGEHLEASIWPYPVLCNSYY